MTRIRLVHAGIGGVVAGIVMNVIGSVAWSFVLPSGTMGRSYLGSFAVAIVTVCLYSGLSSDSGPSPARAVAAGVIAWVFAVAVPNYGLLSLEVMSASLVRLSLVLGSVVVVPAVLAGALTHDLLAERQLARAQEQQPRKSLRVRLTPHTPLSVKAI